MPLELLALDDERNGTVASKSAFRTSRACEHSNKDRREDPHLLDDVQISS